MAKRFHDSYGMINENKSEGYPGYGPAVIDRQLSADTSKIKSIMDPRKV